MFLDLFGNKRGKDLENLAFQLDMKYSRRDEFKMINRLGGFQLFKKGHSRKVKNLITKEDDWLKFRISIFDYQYTVQQGKTAVTINQTVFFMDSKKLGLPKFLLKSEHFFHRIGKSLNLIKDIEFEAHPKFSKKYLVQSDFPEMFKDIASDEFVNFFAIENKWSLEGLNYFLIFYEEKKRLKPTMIKEFYKKGLKIVEMLESEDIGKPNLRDS